MFGFQGISFLVFDFGAILKLKRFLGNFLLPPMGNDGSVRFLVEALSTVIQPLLLPPSFRFEMALIPVPSPSVSTNLYFAA